MCVLYGCCVHWCILQQHTHTQVYSSATYTQHAHRCTAYTQVHSIHTGAQHTAHRLRTSRSASQPAGMEAPPTELEDRASPAEEKTVSSAAVTASEAALTPTRS